TQVESAIEAALPEVDSVQTHLEPLREEAAGRRPDDASVAEGRAAIAQAVEDATGEPPREVRFLDTPEGLVAYLTIGIDAPQPVRVFGPDGLGFAFSNPAAIAGPGVEIAYPEGTSELDYGLGIAAVIGDGGSIGGLTVLNDWNARDLGTGKDTDFATSIGPVV